MAKTSTSFKKGDGRSRKPVGAKHAKTRFKELIGKDNWSKVGQAIEGELAEKLFIELSKLKGKDFVYAYSQLSEFYKPKLSRQQHVGDPEQPVIFKIGYGKQGD